jgi:hypothetical protein
MGREGLSAQPIGAAGNVDVNRASSMMNPRAAFLTMAFATSSTGGISAQVIHGRVLESGSDRPIATVSAANAITHVDEGPRDFRTRAEVARVLYATGSRVPAATSRTQSW